MKDSFPTEAAQTGVSMNNVNLLSNHNVSEYGKERKNGRECCFAVDNEEGNVVDLQSIGEVTDSGASFVCMRDDNDFVPSIDEFLKAIRTMIDGDATRPSAHG
jgi:hypothetical protein